MCGICGIIDFKKTLDLPATIERMSELLHHRGPDDKGVKLWSSPTHEVPHAALGHRRLSVIDLSAAGKQPMTGAGETTAVVLNGEIYNFKEKRAECAGYPYRSNTDTEVILALYEKCGENFVEHIDGMFALALWDNRERKLFLARDRVGKKPLFYYCGKDLFLFASEVKSLLAVAELDPAPNPDALPLYLTYGYVPTPDTFYSEIKKLEPGCILIIDASGKSSIRQFWKYPIPKGRGERNPMLSGGEEEQLRLLLNRAVSRRMIADVPLGAFLSGGIDSSIIVACMSQRSKEPIRTFSIGFEGDAAYDETYYARLVAKAFNTQHTEFRVRPDAIDLLEKLVWHYDEPFGDSSAIPTYLVSKLARDHVTVALSGDGGDELFAGYERFAAAIWAERIPKWALGAARLLTHPIPVPGHAKSGLRRMKRFLEKSLLDFQSRYLEWNSFFTRSELALLLNSAPVGSVATSFEQRFREASEGSILQALLFLNFQTYLLDDLLVKTDRTSMAHALEVRCPFLDTQLVEWAAALPDSLKSHNHQLKYILKRAYNHLLPKEILARKKMGFGVPLGHWMRHDLRNFSHDMLLGPSARIQVFLKRRFVEEILREHADKIQDHGQKLWALLCLEVWLRNTAHWRIQGLAQK